MVEEWILRWLKSAQIVLCYPIPTNSQGCNTPKFHFSVILPVSCGLARKLCLKEVFAQHLLLWSPQRWDRKVPSCLPASWKPFCQKWHITLPLLSFWVRWLYLIAKSSGNGIWHCAQKLKTQKYLVNSLLNYQRRKAASVIPACWGSTNWGSSRKTDFRTPAPTIPQTSQGGLSLPVLVFKSWSA